MFLPITLIIELIKFKVFIGMITELFAFVPTLFLVLIFSMSKIKTKLNEKTNAEFENAKVFQKQKKTSLFFLYKIIAYMLSFVCIAFCTAVILIKGWLILPKKV
jgi:hypothetical protein